ncbi:hypothetical protein X943_002769 [Babesia divergens]|uniref:Uncharacterized protein n=1 Tax=Babesia divergens TaxID=32595 RepID=A0AAD9GFP6_BABDI|nr:hypothetical protein X943_002769 [Babesia divergens]
MDLNLKVVTSLFPWSLKVNDDVSRYIHYLKEGGERIKQLLKLKDNTEHVVADIIRLIEFEDKLQGSSHDENNTTLLYEVVREAMECHYSHASARVINRLYVRGFAKHLVSTIITYMGRTVSVNVKMDCNSMPPGRLKNSNTTVIICSRAMTVMADKIEPIRTENGCYLRFRSIRDYNVALAIMVLFFKSVLVGQEPDNLIQLFHPRSPSHLPLKAQLMIIDVMQDQIKTLQQPSVGPMAKDNEQTNHATARQGESHETHAAEGIKDTSDICNRGTCMGTDLKHDELCDISYELLRRLSLLWAEREEDDHGYKICYIAIAACIVKLMDILYCVDKMLMAPEFERMSTLLSDGINDRLGRLNKNLNTAAMYVATALSKWETKREQLMGHAGDNAIQFDSTEALDNEQLMYLRAARNPFIVQTIENDESIQCASGNLAVETDVVMEKKHKPSGEQPLSTIDEIFKDVPVPDFLAVEPATRKGWTDPPHHIQQCFERLCGIPVVGDVEPSKMFNDAINKPREMSNLQKREMVVQTLLYLPGVIEKSEPMLSRFAVPIAQLLLKMRDVEQYEDALADLRRSLKLGAPVKEEGVDEGPLDIFADQHGNINLETTQHLVYAGLLCLAVRSPDEIFEHFCAAVTDNEYSTIQHATMLMCMQCATKRLSRHKTYRELSRSILNNVSCLKPFVGVVVSHDSYHQRKRVDTLDDITLMLPIKSAVKPITLLPRQQDLIRSTAESSNDIRKNSQHAAEPAKLVEEIDAQSLHPRSPAGGGSISSAIAPGWHTNVLTSGTLINNHSAGVSQHYAPKHEEDINKFAPLANMAVMRILKAAENHLKKEMSHRGASPSYVVTLGVLETLHLFLECSDGRVAHSLIEECKKTIETAYRFTYKTEMQNMLGRILDKIECMSWGLSM